MPSRVYAFRYPGIWRESCSAARHKQTRPLVGIKGPYGNSKKFKLFMIQGKKGGAEALGSGIRLDDLGRGKRDPQVTKTDRSSAEQARQAPGHTLEQGLVGTLRYLERNSLPSLRARGTAQKRVESGIRLADLGRVKRDPRSPRPVMLLANKHIRHPNIP
jgi:hypothetical protein